ncbi:CAP-Gly domain-containing linker protein 1-like [Liolophura sinensis]|uniref:CAP-Gly domain-containing linker protein 1-like n=1 Tax=Liolophura sinensis TaxID=3198878 RepID=UPI00315897C0
MNNKQKTALANSRNFLAKNIVWTPEFAGKLVAEGVLTQFILDDIQKHEGREAIIHALLEVLPLKGGQTFDKFCDLLQWSGHCFLADYLRDEVSKDDIASVKDIQKRLPFLEKLRDFEKKKLESYIADKVREELVKNSWKSEFTEKDKTLAIKEKQIMQTFKHEEENKQNQSTICDLQQRLKGSCEEVSLLKAQISSLKQNMLELDAKHKEQLNRQIKFNLANDSSLRRVQEKIEEQESTLDRIRRKINSVQGVSKKTLDTDDIGIPKPELTTLLEDMDKVLEKLSHLSEVERKYESLQEERDWIIMHLGADGNATSLVQAYKRFAIQNDEHLHTLKEEVAKYSDLVKEQESKGEEARTKERTKNAGNVWQSALMSVMKKQLQDLKIASKQKDKKIEILENEVNDLKSKLAAAEKDLASYAAIESSVNRLHAYADKGDSLKIDTNRSFKNSFLPPLRRGGSPVDGQVVNGRKPKPATGPPMTERGINPRAHHMSETLSGGQYRLDTKVRYGQPYHSLSQGLGASTGHNKGNFQLGEKIIIGKRIQ